MIHLGDGDAWLHQICSFFDGLSIDDEGKQAEDTEMEWGERKPFLEAKDLPRTRLSDHIEHRLFKNLKQEREDRAMQQGKSYDKVAGAEALVVRVVSSVNKKLQVQQPFLDIFREDNYPSEFPYKSKVVLLFQKIEGIEVCLLGMYVQEFGSECSFPNQRRVFLSYLDSLKYFQPEVKTVTGEALREFVYHEIIIGYLEYSKKRGFTSCYIWAVPPLNDEDCILYRNPKFQDMPKSDKLREWYLEILRKASKEQIVVETTNLFDHFFISNVECKAKVTVARLPYFDGDYWPAVAEDLIKELRQASDLSVTKDLLLMHKLGEIISPMKEDFIVVHLQHCCNHCCILMVSGNRWVCNQCRNFQICDKCYEVEQKCEEIYRHHVKYRDNHILYPVEINNVPADTKDKDEVLESEFFDSRQTLLILCQRNHFVFDTLWQAKNSSMIVLYHLHNPTTLGFAICNTCHPNIGSGQGWQSCSDYDVCSSSYQKDGVVDHAQNIEARQQRILMFRRLHDILVHASQCRFRVCPYPNCRKLKDLFRHGAQCKIGSAGGCTFCRQMWIILCLHTRACKKSKCNILRCSDLKEHERRLDKHFDSRRRVVVMEMMRQGAVKAAGNSGFYFKQQESKNVGAKGKLRFRTRYGLF